MEGTHDLLSLGHVWLASNAYHTKFPPIFTKEHAMESQVSNVNTAANTLHVWFTTQTAGIRWLQMLLPSFVSRKLTGYLWNSLHLFTYQHTFGVHFRFSINSYHSILFIKKTFQISRFPVLRSGRQTMALKNIQIQRVSTKIS